MNVKNNRPTERIPLKGLNDTKRRTTTVQGWKEFVRRVSPEKPVLPSDAEWDAMSAAELKAFNRRRHLYHANFAPIATPDLQDFQNQMLLQIWKNIDGDDGARPGGLLDGLGTLGKTTILKNLGRRFEEEFNETFPAEDPSGQHQVIPVAVVTMTARATPKDLSISLARFYGLALPLNTKGVSRSDITAAVIEAAEFYRTQLIMVDEAHFIDVHTDEGQLANNHFKQLMDETSATFVFAGIDCKGLLGEGKPDSRKSQIGGRLMYKGITPMTRDGEVWTGVLVELEQRLCLAALPPQAFSEGLNDYLYMRTSGSIGSLMNLVRKAARVAVDSGVETITREMLDLITIDHNAELRSQEKGLRKTAVGRRAKKQTPTEVTAPGSEAQPSTRAARKRSRK